MQAQLVVLARLEHRGLERAEVAREVELALVVEFLVGEDQHGVLGEGGADGGEVVGGERLAEHDIAHFGGEIGGDRLYGDGHGVPPGCVPILCLAVIGPPNGPACKWREGVPAVETFMMRLKVWFGVFIALLLGLAAAQAAPLDNRDGFWSDWSDATFARAAARRSS